MELKGKEMTSKVLGQEVTVNIKIIAKAIECPGVGNCYYDELQHVCSKTFLHKNNSHDHITKLGRFAIFHMRTGIPFNLPYVIYINMMSNIRGTDGYNFWTYTPV